MKTKLENTKKVVRIIMLASIFPALIACDAGPFWNSKDPIPFEADGKQRALWEPDFDLNDQDFVLSTLVRQVIQVVRSPFGHGFEPVNGETDCKEGGTLKISVAGDYETKLKNNRKIVSGPGNMHFIAEGDNCKEGELFFDGKLESKIRWIETFDKNVPSVSHLRGITGTAQYYGVTMGTRNFYDPLYIDGKVDYVTKDDRIFATPDFSFYVEDIYAGDKNGVVNVQTIEPIKMKSRNLNEYASFYATNTRLKVTGKDYEELILLMFASNQYYKYKEGDEKNKIKL